jgi:hypothetical protein
MGLTEDKELVRELLLSEGDRLNTEDIYGVVKHPDSIFYKSGVVTRDSYSEYAYKIKKYHEKLNILNELGD